ncbi:MAG: hypothetical protein IK095_08560 [Oscillospiraceae bacterium]|nr:hypothetical protein [Oscillospiraceae bacterium]
MTGIELLLAFFRILYRHAPMSREEREALLAALDAPAGSEARAGLSGLMYAEFSSAARTFSPRHLDRGHGELGDYILAARYLPESVSGQERFNWENYAPSDRTMQASDRKRFTRLIDEASLGLTQVRIGIFAILAARLQSLSAGAEAREELLQLFGRELLLPDREQLGQAAQLPAFFSVTTFTLLAAGCCREGQLPEIRAGYAAWLKERGVAPFPFRQQAEEQYLSGYLDALWAKHHLWERRGGDQMLRAAKVFTLQQFTRDGAGPAPACPTLELAQDRCRLICDATGMGKTSFLRASILALICDRARDREGDAPLIAEREREIFRALRERLFSPEDREKLPVYVRGLSFGRQTDRSTGGPDADLLFRIGWASAMVREQDLEDVPDGLDLAGVPAEAVALLSALAEQGKVLLLIDALDEAFDRSRLVAHIRAFRQRYRDCPVLITSRPIHLAVLDNARILHSTWRVGFGPEQQREMIGKWCIKSDERFWQGEASLTEDELADLQARIALLAVDRFARGFAANPYLLTAYLIYTSAVAPKKIGEMLEPIGSLIVQKMFDDDNSMGNGVFTALSEHEFNAAKLLQAFEELAFRVLSEDADRGRGFPEELLKEVLLPRLEQLNALDELLGAGPLASQEAPASAEALSSLEMLLRLSQLTGSPFLARAGAQKPAARIYEKMRMFFTTQPGLLVADEDGRFRFLSPIFLCHMAARYVVRQRLQNISGRREALAELEQFLAPIGALRDGELAVIYCNALIGEANQALRGLKDDRLSRADLFRAVTERTIARLSLAAEPEDAALMLSGVLDILLGSYCATDLSSPANGPQREAVGLCQLQLLLNLLPRESWLRGADPERLRQLRDTELFRSFSDELDAFGLFVRDR